MMPASVYFLCNPYGDSHNDWRPYRDAAGQEGRVAENERLRQVFDQECPPVGSWWDGGDKVRAPGPRHLSELLGAAIDGDMGDDTETGGAE